MFTKKVELSGENVQVRELRDGCRIDAEIDVERLSGSEGTGEGLRHGRTVLRALAVAPQQSVGALLDAGAGERRRFGKLFQRRRLEPVDTGITAPELLTEHRQDRPPSGGAQCLGKCFVVLGR